MSTAAAHYSPLSSDAAVASVGVIGARGYVGRELVRLVLAHPRLRLAFASSESAAGRAISEEIPDAPVDLRFEALDQERVLHEPPDVIVLALANGESARVVAELDGGREAPRLILDVGADFRFDDGWVYGLSESFAPAIARAGRISNPGCYATAMHLALRPLQRLCLIDAHCFGVSGCSGAGATPSDRNDPELLRDNIMPYSLSGHLHEREASRHLGDISLQFAPSVAPFFRGIMLTAMATLREPVDADALRVAAEEAFADEPFVRTLGAQVPTLHEVVGTPFANIGGLEVCARDPRRVTVVCALDNLMKGAASQAVQNINLALGLPMTEGLLP